MWPWWWYGQWVVAVVVVAVGVGVRKWICLRVVKTKNASSDSKNLDRMRVSWSVELSELWS